MSRARRFCPGARDRQRTRHRPRDETHHLLFAIVAVVVGFGEGRHGMREGGF